MHHEEFPPWYPVFDFRDIQGFQTSVVAASLVVQSLALVNLSDDYSGLSFRLPDLTAATSKRTSLVYQSLGSPLSQNEIPW